MLKRVHHVDFVVNDLDAAAAAYSRILGLEPLGRERLEERGVELVRFELDNAWIILVQPIAERGPVKDFLERHGEGFFHIGFQVEDILVEAARLEAEGLNLVHRAPRLGVEGWQLVDLDMAETFGVYLQLVQDDIS